MRRSQKINRLAQLSRAAAAMLKCQPSEHQQALVHKRELRLNIELEKILKKIIPRGKTAVFTLGRYQPFHQGHMVVVKTVIFIANIIDGKAYIAISETGGKDKKNPLIPSDKEDIINAALKLEGLNNSITPMKRNIGNMIQIFAGKEYDNVLLVIGCDRYEDFNWLWKIFKDKNIRFYIKSNI